MNNNILQRGQIWYAELIGKDSMMIKNRPVIIFQNEMANRYSSLITVIPLTSNTKKTLPTHTIIKSCMHKDSIALAENIITISKDMLINYIGKVNEYELKQLEYSVLIQLGIQPIQNSKAI